MKLIVVGVLGALLALPSSSGAQASQSAVPCAVGNLDQEDPATIRAVGDFLSQLQTDIRENRRAKLAELIEYPLLVATYDGRKQVHSEKEFIEGYDKIFPVALRDVIIHQRSQCVSRVGAQGFTIGTGELWFNVFEGARMKIFTINPVVPQPSK